MASIEILSDPGDYFSVLRQKISSSKNEIILSALYFGWSNFECENLLSDIDNALSRNLELTITLILDYSRSLRKNDSSLDAISCLKSKHLHRFRLLLYKMPKSSYFMSPQINEILNVFHCKFCVFDQDVLLTGANLSREYFTDRQDRYILIREHGSAIKIDDSMCSFLREFSRILSEYCYSLEAGYEIRSPPRSAVHDLSARDRLNRLCANFSAGQDQSTTRFFPVIQHASIGVQQEEDTIPKLFNSFSSFCTTNHFENPHIVISSPYPSFTIKFMHVIDQFLHSHENAIIEMITASPSTHGFSKAGGLKSLIPKLHEQAFQDALTFTERTFIKVASLRYIRPNWTFHPKGLWMFTSKPQLLSQHFSSDASECSHTGPTVGATKNISVGARYAEYDRGSAGTRSDCASVDTDIFTPWWRDTASALLNQSKLSIHIENDHVSQTQSLRSGISTQPSTPPLPHSDHVAVTYIGSSNFGARSWARDFELGFIIATNDPVLCDALQRESMNLKNHCRLDSGEPSPHHSHTGSLINAAAMTPACSDRPAPLYSSVKKTPSNSLFNKTTVQLLTKLFRSFL